MTEFQITQTRNVDQFYKAISWRLMGLRQKAGMDANQAAIKAGVTARSWRLWETGDRRPTAWSMIKVCEAFDCSLGWLITGKPDPAIDWLIMGRCAVH